MSKPKSLISALKGQKEEKAFVETCLKYSPIEVATLLFHSYGKSVVSNSNPIYLTQEQFDANFRIKEISKAGRPKKEE